MTETQTEFTPPVPKSTITSRQILNLFDAIAHDAGRPWYALAAMVEVGVICGTFASKEARLDAIAAFFEDCAAVARESIKGSAAK